jgi:peptidylprolyl isomerase
MLVLYFARYSSGSPSNSALNQIILLASYLETAVITDSDKTNSWKYRVIMKHQEGDTLMILLSGKKHDSRRNLAHGANMLISFLAGGYSMKDGCAIGKVFAVIVIVLVIVAAVVIYQFMGSPDSTPPAYSNISASSTRAGSSCTFNVLWTDNVNVSGYIFETNNTGTFANDTWTPFSNFVNSTFAYSSVSKTLNSTIGNVVRWRFWCNDTSNNWNRITLHNLLADSNKALLMTSMGNITIELYGDMSITTGNFKNLIRRGVYDGTIFHRVVHGFAIQGGDPTGTGLGDPNITAIPDEFTSNNKNYMGTVAMANKGPNTGSSQFFINLADNNQQPDFDTTYPVFGYVLDGMDVVNAIGNVPTDTQSDKPLQDVILIKALLIN